MKSFVFALTILAAGVVAADDAGSFVPLFNGKDLAGWQVKADKPAAGDEWSVHDGILTAKPGSGWLSTTETYGDFVLRLEWRVPENGNSGVFVRVPPLAKGEQPHVKGIEIQVLDDRGSQYSGKLKPWQFSGSIYGAVPAANSTFKGAGQWNSYEITCRGEHIEVVFNGRTVAEADVTKIPELAARPRRGFIGLQNHGSGVEYRNIAITALSGAASSIK